MSSHHIVRDHQEPALLIRSLHKTPFVKVAGLLEWNPLIIVNEASFEQIVGLGIKIDVLLTGAVSSTLPNELLEQQQPLNMVRAMPEDEIVIAIRYLIERGATDLTLLDDDWSWSFHRPELELINVTIISDNVRWIFVRKGEIRKVVQHQTAYLIQQDGTTEIRQAANGWIEEQHQVPFWLGEYLPAD